MDILELDVSLHLFEFDGRFGFGDFLFFFHELEHTLRRPGHTREVSFHFEDGYGSQYDVSATVEIEGEDKPALVAEWLSLHVVRE